MKFKVGDTISLESDTRGVFKVLYINDFDYRLLTLETGRVDSYPIRTVDNMCKLVKLVNTKLGKVLYK